MLSRAAVLVLMLVGCLSPDQEPGADNPWASPPGAAAPAVPPPAPAAPASSASVPVAGASSEDATRPAADNATAPPSDGSCQPAAYAIESHPRGGSMVTLSGAVDGLTSQGTMLIELVDPVQQMSVYGVACPMSSAFSIAVPADLGEVALAIFIDGNGNGPDSSDAAGRYAERLQIAAADLSGLDISVSAAADLGDIPPPYSMPGGPMTDGIPAGSGTDAAPGGPSDVGVPPGSDAAQDPGTEPAEADGATPPQGADGASEGSK